MRGGGCGGGGCCEAGGMRAGYLHSGEGEGEGQVRASEGNALGQNGGKDDVLILPRGTTGGTPPPTRQEDTHVAATRLTVE